MAAPTASPSSRGPGRGPFKAKTRVRIPSGTPNLLYLGSCHPDDTSALVLLSSHSYGSDRQVPVRAMAIADVEEGRDQWKIGAEFRDPYDDSAAER